ncbi:MAG: hypothetical protein ACPGUV_09850, partial [Polyangiales bacterium]
MQTDRVTESHPIILDLCTISCVSPTYAMSMVWGLCLCGLASGCALEGGAGETERSKLEEGSRLQLDSKTAILARKTTAGFGFQLVTQEGKESCWKELGDGVVALRRDDTTSTLLSGCVDRGIAGVYAG